MAKTIKVSGNIDRQLHSKVKGLAAEQGVAFGYIVTEALEKFCAEIVKRPDMLKGFPKDGRMTA